MNLDDLNKGLSEAVDGFKKLQITLIIFCLLITILLIIHTIKIIK